MSLIDRIIVTASGIMLGGLALVGLLGMVLR